MDNFAALKAQFDTFGSEVKEMASDISELLDRQDKIEVRLNRPGMGAEIDQFGDSTKPKASKRRAAFVEYLRRGDGNMQPDRRAELFTSDDTAGGYLAPPDYVNEILRTVVVFSPIRSVARIAQTGNKTVLVPKRTATLTSAWVSELDARPLTGPIYGQAEWPIAEMAAVVEVSNSLMEDIPFNFENELSFDLGEQWGKLEGQAFVAGSGIKQPEGIMIAPNVPVTLSGFAATITADNLFTLLYSLAPFYRARSTWIMNSSTLALIRTLKDGVGQYLWQAGLAAGQPETLIGRPILECPDCASVAAQSFPIAVGDFASGYRIYDHPLSFQLLRDPFSAAINGITRFHGRRRVGGGVAIEAAIAKLKVGTS